MAFAAMTLRVKAKLQRLLQRSRRKVFCIGANKTGTTTMEHVLRSLGYRMGDQFRAESQITRKILEGHSKEFIAYCQSADAFQDVPFSLHDVYVAADVFFPGSRFILTVRDPGEWFDSMCRFHQKLYGITDLSRITEVDVRDKFMPHVPGLSHYLSSKALYNTEGTEDFVDWRKLYDKAWYCGQFEQRNLRIKRYFSNRPEDLLVIDVTQEFDNSRIVRFLDLPDDLVTRMPHANRT